MRRKALNIRDKDKENLINQIMQFTSEVFVRRLGGDLYDMKFYYYIPVSYGYRIGGGGGHLFCSFSICPHHRMSVIDILKQYNIKSFYYSYDKDCKLEIADGCVKWEKFDKIEEQDYEAFLNYQVKTTFLEPQSLCCETEEETEI